METEELSGVQPTKTPEEMIAWLRAFRTELSRQLSGNRPVLDMIPT